VITAGEPPLRFDADGADQVDGAGATLATTAGHLRRRGAGIGESRASIKRLHHPVAWLRWIISNGRRLLVLLAGMAVLGAGLAMLVLPGPGVLVVIAGLGVLATEFAWAERMLDRTRARAAATTGSLTATRTGQAALSVSAIAMITGGGAVAAVVDRYRTIGVTTLVAGLCALAILVPSVQRWINRPSAAPSDRGNAPVPGDGTRPGATQPHPTKGLPT